MIATAREDRLAEELYDIQQKSGIEAARQEAYRLDRHELYFMCDDLRAEILALGNKGVRCSQVQEAKWGSITKIQMPGGSEVGLYQPRHPFALAFTPNWPPHSE